MKILCVFGKYQYGKKERGINTEYFSFMPAFEDLNYEVIFFDSWDRTLHDNFIDLNKKLIQIVNEENPDIIFSVQLGYEIWIETWDYIRFNFKCKTINWCTDDSWKYREQNKFLAPHFDLMVTPYEESVSKHEAENNNVFLSGWGVPIQWVQKPKNTLECQYKVSFIGASHPARRKKVKELRNYGIEVECFGYGWDSGPINHSDIPKKINDSMINLNFSNSHSAEEQIKARIFEVTGSGGFLLTENAINLNKIFNKNEIIVFSDIKDCAKKIKFYLDNPNERILIANDGFKKTSQNYSYANRLKSIIKYTDSLEKKNIIDIDFNKTLKAHKKSIFLNIIKYILVLLGRIFFKKEKAFRFARRVVFEFSWRLFKENTYRSKTIVGRIFYNE